MKIQDLKIYLNLIQKANPNYHNQIKLFSNQHQRSRMLSLI